MTHFISFTYLIIKRLSGHLAKGLPMEALNAYWALLRKWCPAHPVIHIDNNNVVKPDGHKFKALG